ncbi:hypothetical protein ABIA25_000296 [Sinorhizobium fredii]|uniref:hypothetical protein n=1 Tax=Rhizobium fredii TaxID=380 RepID=UPI003519CCD0
MHKDAFIGRSQVAKADVKPSTYRQPVAIRDGKEFFTQAEVDAYDEQQQQQQDIDND